MNLGIVSYGIYLPRYRLANNTIAAAWKRLPIKAEQQPLQDKLRPDPIGSEKAIANFDEDSLTMGVEAAFDTLDLIKSLPESLFFASTTTPYREKSSAGLVGSVLDLSELTRTADLTNSLRSATTALFSAIDMMKSTLIVASDCRTA